MSAARNATGRSPTGKISVGFDVTVFWEHDRLDARHVSGEGACYEIGEHPRCDHVAPGFSRHPLARVVGEGVEVRIPGTGEVRRLAPGQSLDVGLGTLCFHVAAVRAGAVILAPIHKPDGWFSSLFGATMLHLVAVATIISLPRDAARLDLDSFETSSQIVKFMSLPEESTPPPDPQKLFEALTERARAEGVADRSEVSTAAPRVPKATVTDPLAQVAQANARREKAKIQAMAAADAVSHALESQLAGLGSPGFGGDTATALNNLQPTPGGVGGGGGDFFGTAPGPGAGGPFTGGALTGMDVGGFRTRGGKDPASGPYGTGVTNYGPHGPKGPPGKLVALKPEVSDGLDIELVRRVIRQHQAEYRYCYERRLNVNHDLEGKIVVKFTIGGTGNILAAAVEEDTSGDGEVGSCIVEHVRQWTFPAPAGGGMVIVRYPFVFRHAP